jgi:preprotein translocase subunit SecA
MDHIDAMDELRRGIYLRGYGQRDPVIEYRVEGSEMYDAMVESIREQTVKMLLTVRVQKEEPIKREQVAKPAEMRGEIATQKKASSEKKVGRNDPCPCGSGKKYKKCCGR